MPNDMGDHRGRRNVGRAVRFGGKAIIGTSKVGLKVLGGVSRTGKKVTGSLGSAPSSVGSVDEFSDKLSPL
jgi:hypothetical protein